MAAVMLYPIPRVNDLNFDQGIHHTVQLRLLESAIRDGRALFQPNR